MKEIPLTRGKVALVDDQDYERVAAYSWCAMPAPGGLWYALTAHGILLHRFLLDAPANKMVDHVDRNGLNCQRYNMRLATNAENQHNAKKRTDNTSGYRGVWANKGKWIASIKIEGKPCYLGRFNSPEEAARAYDAKARETRGEFARTNF